jgi:hypothetical protein
LQASHPCELVWDHGDQPQPLLSAEGRSASTGLAATRSGGSDAGSVAGGVGPSRSGSIGTGGSARSDRSQSEGEPQPSSLIFKLRNQLILPLKAGLTIVALFSAGHALLTWPPAAGFARSSILRWM